MRSKLAARLLLFAMLCVCLTSENLWLKKGLASNTGRIVFTSFRDGNFEIYVMDADGGNQKNLSNHPAYDSQPDWSPDGKRITFVSWRDGGNEIYVIGDSGLGRRRVTQDFVGKLNPSFSPDGRRIAYEAHHEEFHHIYVVGADGRNRVRLTHNEEHHGRPAWSPDGRIIAYDVLDGIWPDFRGEIHLMTADGKYLRQLSDDRGARDFDSDISPLGLAVFPNSNKTTTWGRVKKRASNLR